MWKFPGQCAAVSPAVHVWNGDKKLTFPWSQGVQGHPHPPLCTAGLGHRLPSLWAPLFLPLLLFLLEWAELGAQGRLSTKHLSEPRGWGAWIAGSGGHGSRSNLRGCLSLLSFICPKAMDRIPGQEESPCACMCHCCSPHTCLLLGPSGPWPWVPSASFTSQLFLMPCAGGGASKTRPETPDPSSWLRTPHPLPGAAEPVPGRERVRQGPTSPGSACISC